MMKDQNIPLFRLGIGGNMSDAGSDATLLEDPNDNSINKGCIYPPLS